MQIFSITYTRICYMYILFLVTHINVLLRSYERQIVGVKKKCHVYSCVRGKVSYLNPYVAGYIISRRMNNFHSIKTILDLQDFHSFLFLILPILFVLNKFRFTFSFIPFFFSSCVTAKQYSPQPR